MCAKMKRCEIEVSNLPYRVIHEIRCIYVEQSIYSVRLTLQLCKPNTKVSMKINGILALYY